MEASAPAPEVESTESHAAQASVKEPQEAATPQREKPLPLQLTIENPQHGETIRSNQGLITVQITLNRKLGIGEQLQLLLDGNPYGAPQNRPEKLSVLIGWSVANAKRMSPNFRE